jgi:NNP family nitrate/nitrite transporter-like MFS transporter
LKTSYSTVLELIKKEFALTYTMSGALMSSYFVGYTIGQIPWGFFADKFGSRRAMTTSIFGIACSTLFFSLSEGFWQAIVARFLSGLLGAGVFVPGVRLVSDWFTSEKRGTALGILSIGGSLGLIFSSWAVPLSSVRWGWRVTMAVIGTFGFFAVGLIWYTLKDKTAGKITMNVNNISGVFRTRNFWIMAFVQFVRLGSNYTYIAWLPLILREEYGLSLVVAGAVYSLFNITGMISNPLGGIISDKLGERSVLFITFIILGIFTYIFMGIETSFSMYLTVAVMGWCINFVRSPSFAILPKLYGIERAGRISGIHNTFASAGALCLPLLLGYIRDTTNSYYIGWIMLSLTIISASILVIAFRMSSDEIYHSTCKIEN